MIPSLVSRSSSSLLSSPFPVSLLFSLSCSLPACSSSSNRFSRVVPSSVTSSCFFSSSSSSFSSSPSSSSSSSSSSLRAWHDFNSAGLRYLHSNDLSSACTMFLSAMKEEGIGEGKGPHIYLSLCNLATVHRLQHKFKESESEYKYAIPRLEPYVLQQENNNKNNNSLINNNTKTNAVPLSTIANLYRQCGLTLECSGKWLEAEHYYHKAMNAYSSFLSSSSSSSLPQSQEELNELKKELAGSAYAIAYVQQQQWNNEPNEQMKRRIGEKAEESFHEAVDCALKAYDGDSVNMAELYRERGQFLVEIGKKEKGQEDYLLAIEGYKKNKEARVVDALRGYLKTIMDDEQQIELLIKNMIVSNNTNTSTNNTK